jgi:hypothetical protein
VPVHLSGVDDHVVEHDAPSILREQEGVSADHIMSTVRELCGGGAPVFRGSELSAAKPR